MLVMNPEINYYNQKLKSESPKRIKNKYCGNCGRKGHLYRECTDDITSFGVIAIRRKKSDKLPDSKKIELNIKENDEENPLRILLIQRKDTMAYVDLIRGRYPDVENLKDKYLTILFEEMIPEERHRIIKMSFDELWDDLWVNHNSKCYKNEKETAKLKYNKLDKNVYLNKTSPVWNFTEFGIPKGRRNMKETNRQCAEREFCEETGYTPKDYRMLTIEPHLYESFVGTNGKRYKHVYYIAEILPQASDPVLDVENKNQMGEVKDILWMSKRESLSVIREYDTAKKEVIEKVFNSFAKF